MAGFDESALKRLEALVSKTKAGPKLPPSEALELKELKLLKSAAEIAKGRAEIAVAKRKIEDREKYRVGGLALAAGLSAWSDEKLKVAFAGLVAGESKPGTENGAAIPVDILATTEHAGADERLL